MEPSGPIVVAVTDSEVRLLAQSVRVLVWQCPLSACTKVFKVAAPAALTVLPFGVWKGITPRKLAGYMLLVWEVGDGDWRSLRHLCFTKLYCRRAYCRNLPPECTDTTTSLTQASVRAVEYAAGFLAEPGDELLLVHVLYEAPLLCLVSLLHRPLARSTAFLQRRFAPALSAAAAAGVSHRLAVLRGEACCGARVSVAQALCLQAREVCARALVLGSSGVQCALGRLLGRSTVVKQITRAASTPVIVAPARPAEPSGKECGKGASARVPQPRKRMFLEAISPRAGSGAIGAWRALPLQPRLSYNKLRGDEADCQRSDGAARAHCAPSEKGASLGKGGADWQPNDGRGRPAAAPLPRPLSPERASGLRDPAPAAAVDAAAYLRRAAEAQRRAEAAGVAHPFAKLNLLI